MPRVGFEPTISAGERPKTYALDRAATGTGLRNVIKATNSGKGWVGNVACIRQKVISCRILTEELEGEGPLENLTHK